MVANIQNPNKLLHEPKATTTMQKVKTMKKSPKNKENNPKITKILN